MPFYIVVSPQKVYVDYLDGRVLGFSTGQVFDAPSTLPSVETLLRAYPTTIVPFTPSEAFVAAPAGVPGGAATLDNSGQVPEVQIPVIDNSKLPPFKSRVFTGSNGAGSIAVTGLLVGEEVIGLWILDGSVEDSTGEFEAVISVDGEIQQTSAADYSLNQFLLLVS